MGEMNTTTFITGQQGLLPLIMPASQQAHWHLNSLPHDDCNKGLSFLPDYYREQVMSLPVSMAFLQ